MISNFNQFNNHLDNKRTDLKNRIKIKQLHSCQQHTLIKNCLSEIMKIREIAFLQQNKKKESISFLKSIKK